MTPTDVVDRFLRASCAEPITRIPRPLPYHLEMTSLGLPCWSTDLLDALPFDSTLLDVMSAADSMNVEMLCQLIAARIAVEVLKGVNHLSHRPSAEAMATARDKARTATKLAEDNAWAFEADVDVTPDICRAPDSDVLGTIARAPMRDGAVSCTVDGPVSIDFTQRICEINQALRANLVHAEDDLPKFFLRSPYARMIALFL